MTEVAMADNQHRFRSKAQWRFAFATKKPWARRWAHATPSFKALPRRKTRGNALRRLAAKAQ